MDSLKESVSLPCKLYHILLFFYHSNRGQTRLFGITVSQFYVYYKNWDRDSRWTRALAIIVMYVVLLIQLNEEKLNSHRSFEIIFTVFSLRIQYLYAVLSIGNPLVFVEIDWYISFC